MGILFRKEGIILIAFFRFSSQSSTYIHFHMINHRFVMLDMVDFKNFNTQQMTKYNTGDRNVKQKST